MCHNVTGQCRCLIGVIGQSCTACTAGFFGSPPDCIGCGECYNNWTRIIDELVLMVETVDRDISDALQEHYGEFTLQQLLSNVTLLQILLDKVSNFSTSTVSLSSAVAQLEHDLDTVSNKR
jgi:coxsackievirus/adenovirus receptor